MKNLLKRKTPILSNRQLLSDDLVKHLTEVETVHRVWITVDGATEHGLCMKIVDGEDTNKYGYIFITSESVQITSSAANFMDSMETIKKYFEKLRF